MVPVRSQHLGPSPSQHALFCGVEGHRERFRDASASVRETGRGSTFRSVEKRVPLSRGVTRFPGVPLCSRALRPAVQPHALPQELCPSLQMLLPLCLPAPQWAPG